MVTMLESDPIGTIRLWHSNTPIPEGWREVHNLTHEPSGVAWPPFLPYRWIERVA
ncbi:MAG: hypothetical protein JNG90_19460 [Planctomycetaceae bacterium]|nr:hypothetical protein [Planctomycetaceae bacterium]